MHTCGKASESLQESTICMVLINTYRHIQPIYIYIYMEPIYKPSIQNHICIYIYKPIYIFV